MIYLVGDTHGKFDCLSNKRFPEQETMTKKDYVIILGDCGLIFTNEASTEYNINILNNRNFTTLFIDGNHDNHFKLKNNYKTKRWKSGRITKISDSIFHLKRGEIFHLDNNTIFTMGGAFSLDREYREKNVDWWEDEIPSRNEMIYGQNNLFNYYNNSVDYILTHSAPKLIYSQVFKPLYYSNFDNYLDELYTTIKFKKWYCGHYHINKEIDKLRMVDIDNIIKLGD